ncbi:MAG: cytochrome c [Pseudomonadota bacterium]
MKALALVFVFASSAALAQDRGEAIFKEVAVPQCGVCHTLAAAGTQGQIGPVLDELKPAADRVAAAVSQGVGVMPSYGDALSAADIAAVATYVAKATGAE